MEIQASLPARVMRVQSRTEGEKTMPVRLNVGASKKVGEANYGSRGASVNIEMELDSGLIAEPNKLREKIRQLFTLVRSSLAEELNGNGRKEETSTPPAPSASAQLNGSSPAQPSNSNRNQQAQRSSTVRLATPAQVKALYAISRQKGADLRGLLRERFSVGRPDDLTVSQASSLIDDLKAQTRGEGG
jgi:hypothetical protein